MADRDINGRFIKGNKLSKKKDEEKLSGQISQLKRRNKAIVVQAANDFLEGSWKTIKDDLQKDSTRFEYVIAKAISKNNFKFLQWLVEMGSYKPTQTLSTEDGNNTFTLNYKIDKGE